MIRNTLKMVFDANCRDAALSVLRGVIEPTCAQPGCVDSCLCEDVRAAGRVCLSTVWRGQPELERFLRSSTYDRILAVVEMATHTPEIDFEDIMEKRGIEYVAAVRSIGRR